MMLFFTLFILKIRNIFCYLITYNITALSKLNVSSTFLSPLIIVSFIEFIVLFNKLSLLFSILFAFKNLLSFNLAQLLNLINKINYNNIIKKEYFFIFIFIYLIFNKIKIN